jgi:serine/threonine-protein phosphatase 2A activator
MRIRSDPFCRESNVPKSLHQVNISRSQFDIMNPPPTPEPSQSFAQLEVLDSSKPHAFFRPSKQITDGADVARFLTSRAYRDIGIFVMQLNRALCPRLPPSLPESSASQPEATATTFPLDASMTYPEPVQNIQALLGRLEAMIEEAPPDPGPRRFGNVSFRTWHAMLEERCDALLGDYLPREILRFGSGTAEDAEGDELNDIGPTEELKAYFIGGFGSAQRLDYGTGHELSFVTFLGCLWKLGAFRQPSGELAPGQMERFLVLGVIQPLVLLLPLDHQSLPHRTDRHQVTFESSAA